MASLQNAIELDKMLSDDTEENEPGNKLNRRASTMSHKGLSRLSDKTYVFMDSGKLTCILSVPRPVKDNGELLGILADVMDQVRVEIVQDEMEMGKREINGRLT